MQKTIDGIILSAIVAGREYQRIPAFWFESIRHTPLSRGSLTLADPSGEEAQQVTKGDPVTLVMAYRGEPASHWQGEVIAMKPSDKHQLELALAGGDVVFSRTRSTLAWMDETPEAIMKNLLSQAGIPAGQMASTGCQLPRFAVSNETLWQAAEKLELTCQRSFARSMQGMALWMDATGTAHWSDADDPVQEEIPTIFTGGNLITHTPSADATSLSMVETFLLPSLRHSYLFTLQDMHRDISGQCRALKVRSEASGHKARTYIWYGDERSRY